MALKIESLHVYPLKGGRGFPLSAMRLETRGPAGDRRWVATDEDGVSLTQRDCAALARIIAIPEDGAVHFSTDDDRGGVFVAPEAKAPRRRIRVWNDEIDAASAGGQADAWMSGALGRPARLFHMDDAATRETSGRWVAPSPVSFADAYPVLMTNPASLDALNEAIEEAGGDAAAGMERFRPNIVVSGDAAWAEDYWKVIDLGGAVIELVKPCDRCVVTTKDQRTGESLGKEPLKTLAKLRRSAHPDLNGVLFGWNAVVRKEGAVSVGAAARIIERRAEGFALVAS